MLLVASPSPVLADAVDSKVAQARGSTLPIRSELEQTANSSAARQAAADQLGHASLGHLTAICSRVAEVVGTGPNLDAIFDAFRNSPDHWNTITDPAWTAMGTGASTSDSGMLYVSVVFCIESDGGDQPPPPPPPPEPEPEEPAPAPKVASFPSPPPPEEPVVWVKISIIFGPSPFIPLEDWIKGMEPTVT